MNESPVAVLILVVLRAIRPSQLVKTNMRSVVRWGMNEHGHRSGRIKGQCEENESGT